MAEPPPEGKYYQLFRYSGLGCTFAAAIMVFMVGGWLLDRALGLTPIFTIGGALGGAALASVNLYQKLRLGDLDRPRRRRSGGGQ